MEIASMNPWLEGSRLPKKYGASGGGQTDPCWFSDLARLVSGKKTSRTHMTFLTGCH